MINAGDLKFQITLQKKSVTRDSYGGEIIAWVDIDTVWASIVSDSGKEFYAAQKLNAEITALMTIRYRRELTSDMQVKYGTRIFNILFVNDINEAHEEIKLLCKEVA